VSARPIPPRPGPGGARERLAQMLRVDHAGELGAVWILKGQRAVLGRSGRAIAGQLELMEAQEAEHLAAFNQRLTEARVRPTLMAPIWRAAGFALGAATALIGETTVHACTEAVETAIEEHYADQIAELEMREPELAADLSKYRDDELAHLDLAIEGGAREAPFHALLADAIEAGCRAAIAISEKF
jgi:3-demethoxyubiquinol 3-hydroxylase